MDPISRAFIEDYKIELKKIPIYKKLLYSIAIITYVSTLMGIYVTHHTHFLVGNLTLLLTQIRQMERYTQREMQINLLLQKNEIIERIDKNANRLYFK